VTARCGSCRLTLQRLAASSRWSDAVACARPGSRGVGVSFRGFWCLPSSALVALRAPPSPFETASGCFPTDLTPVTKAREILSWSSLPLQSRTASRLPAPRVCLGPLTRTWAPYQARESPLLGFLLPRAPRRRVPLSPQGGSSLREGAFAPSRSPQSRGAEGGGRQAPTGAVLRVLAPLDGSWLRSRHARTPCGTRRHRDAPTLRGLVSCRSRPLESPFRAFPSRGAVPALAGLLLPCGFAFDRPTARQVRGVRDTFRRRADLLPRLARRLAGRKGRDDGSLESLGVVRSACALLAASRLGSAGLAGLGGRHARFEALLPSRVRSLGDRLPGQGAIVRSVLSWASFPLELAPAARGCGVRADERRRASPATHALECSCPGHACSPGRSSGRGV